MPNFMVVRFLTSEITWRRQTDRQTNKQTNKQTDKAIYIVDCRTNEYFKNIIFDNNNGDNNEDDNNGDIDNENMYTYFGDDDCSVEGINIS